MCEKSLLLSVDMNRTVNQQWDAVANGVSVCWHGIPGTRTAEELKESTQVECGGLSSVWDVTI